MYVDFIDLEKAYDRDNREALWQVLKMYDVGGGGVNWRLPGLLYVDDLVLCGELEEDLRAMVE